MAISYPLTPPDELRFASIRWIQRSVVGVSPSTFTRQQQTYVHQGQWWESEIVTPPMKRDRMAVVSAFLGALNGREGTFQLGDKIGASSRGTIAGSPTVNGTATRGSSTLSLTGHTGTLALGDWIQIGTNLYLVTQVNSGTSVDLFPRLRSAYVNGTAIVYTNAVGIFRLIDSVPWIGNSRKVYDGLSIQAVEAF